jgi:hypothetical protein
MKIYWNQMLMSMAQLASFVKTNLNQVLIWTVLLASLAFNGWNYYRVDLLSDANYETDGLQWWAIQRLRDKVGIENTPLQPTDWRVSESDARVARIREEQADGR